jgi:magnesium transporter
MSRFLKRSSKKAGSAPGTLVHIGEKKTDRAIITLIEYDADHYTSRRILSPEELEALPTHSEEIRWINVDGLHDMAIIEAIGRLFDIHPLTLEDIINTGHRPKAEEFDSYLYAIIKMLHFQDGDTVITSEQVSLIIRDRLLISFQEQEGDIFDPVRERIQKGKGRIRLSGSDYLAYALLDTVVDHYYQILETFGEELELLEEAILENPERESLNRIHQLKRETIYMRKQIWPLRETINSLSREESPFISEPTRVFMRDVHDHTVQVIEIIESYRDIVTGLIDLYLSGISNKMNEVMKVLTIIATIFIPITFVAGVYGMNFKNMPELDWRWGYAGAWSVMLCIVVLMIGYFKKKEWW